MTNEEASTAIKTWAGAMKNTYSHNDFAREFIEAAETAVLPLEKQIPKKPNMYWNDVAGHWSALCPNRCLTTVGEGNYCEDHFKNNFCPNCGQRILWEGEDDK